MEKVKSVLGFIVLLVCYSIGGTSIGLLTNWGDDERFQLKAILFPVFSGALGATFLMLISYPTFLENQRKAKEKSQAASSPNEVKTGSKRKQGRTSPAE